VGLSSLQFLQLTGRLVRKPDGKAALRLFTFSNIYLGVVLLSAMIVALVG
jgi:heme O synthase-like polyprenyltransferase